MESDHRYEAWRNFILILAALLVGDCFTKFGEIKQAILSLVAFDKTFDTSYWPELLTILVVLYVTKNAHGILITLFDLEYVRRIKHSRTQIIFFFVFTAAVTLSFAFVLRLVVAVEYGTSLPERSARLMWYTLFPSVILLIFDLLHHFFVFNYRGIDHRFVTFFKELARNPLQRRKHHEFKRIWLFEDILTILALAFWWIAITVVIRSPGYKLMVTIISFVLILVINSLFDYVMNCNYFFSHPIKKLLNQKQQQ